ncbi:5239_t:CDS:2, partial [Racocetra fulgida]
NCSSGGYNGTNNLKPEYYNAFAKYLTDVVDWYSKQEITFRTLEPFNEPSSKDFWQEYDLSNKTSISAVDENKFNQEVSTIECIDDDAKSYVSQYNTHAYRGNQRLKLLNISKQDRKKLWMSEV